MAIVAGIEQGQNVVTGTLGSVSVGSSRRCEGTFSFAVWGTFVGTVILVRSFDAGTTWIPVSTPNTAVTFAAPGTIDMPASGEIGVLYAASCTAYTSGTISYRLSR